MPSSGTVIHILCSGPEEPACPGLRCKGPSGRQLLKAFLQAFVAVVTGDAPPTVLLGRPADRTGCNCRNTEPAARGPVKRWQNV
jgi:hypothetical protein